MAAVQLERPLTYDDLLQMPDDRKRYEIINGVLFVSPSPNRAHQQVSVRLFRLLDTFAARHDLGEVYYAPVDVRLTPYSVVEPDILFISTDRLAIYTEKGVVEGPPDLVVEIVSPSSTRVDAIDKAALYASAGVPEYWLTNPETKTFRLLILGSDGTYRDAEAADGRFQSTVIPGLVIDPATLFAGLD